jgi:diaminohydroxyphosphoribosylaminopyrimidine deaminase/5-amino-6-(5-phosphoribosylamino)uracil reductase
VVVFAGPDAPEARAERLRQRGVIVARLPLSRGRLNLEKALRYLAGREVTRLLVEGGGELHGSFIGQRLADRLVLYLAPCLIGGRDARSLVGGEGPRRLSGATQLGHMISYRVGAELVIEADIRR